MDGIIALKQAIINRILEAADQAQKSGKLPAINLGELSIEHPQKPEYGDYASSLPLKLARSTGLNPMIIAGEIIKLIPPSPEISQITAAPPGFINIKLSPDWIAGQVESVIRAGEKFGDIEFKNRCRLQIEFVSVNPTGPLHVGHGRGAILGSTLANVLAAAGYTIEKEYYINDAGAQITAFYNTLYARYRQAFGQEAEIPANGYKGAYMLDLAREIIDEKGDAFLKMAESEAIPKLGKIGLEKMIGQIRQDLELMDVRFDRWFSEKSLFESGEYDRVMSMLKDKGYIVEKEGATWFESTALGEGKDNVVVRGDGSPTYFASDIAYHYNKFISRNFDMVIDIWGSDHLGHVSRMKAVVGALGIDPARLKVIISQMVTLKRGNEVAKMSKRSGDTEPLRDVLEEVGADACRFNFLSRSADAQMDFDLELAKKESPDNPVYYIHYAHARISSIMRLAEERRIDFTDGDVSLLTLEPELVLLRKVVLLPEIIEVVAQTLEPHHLAYYALDLATVFHSFYKQCRVVTDDVALTKARLKLVLAARIAFARALRLMGMSVLERM